MNDGLKIFEKYLTLLGRHFFLFLEKMTRKLVKIIIKKEILRKLLFVEIESLKRNLVAAVPMQKSKIFFNTENKRFHLLKKLV